MRSVLKVSEKSLLTEKGNGHSIKNTHCTKKWSFFVIDFFSKCEKSAGKCGIYVNLENVIVSEYFFCHNTILTLFFPRFFFDHPENIRKPLVEKEHWEEKD